MKKVEAFLVNSLVLLTVITTAIMARIYILFAGKKHYPLLLSEMTGIDPLFINSDVYWVRGTLLTIAPSDREGKYEIYQSVGDTYPLTEKIKLEDLMEKYPAKTTERFLYNIKSFV